MTAETKKIKKTVKKVAPVKQKALKKKVKEEKEETRKVREIKVKETQETFVLPAKVIEEKKRGHLYAIGRRKAAIATIKLYKNGKGSITVNGKLYSNYFPTDELEQIVSAPMKSVGQADKIDIEARVSGGGPRGQAEAVRLGISRALVQLNINFKKNLRRAGFLTRDPRVKERKKPGLKRARRAPQWQKR
jgi:small subunit ribosomal protein S9